MTDKLLQRIQKRYDMIPVDAGEYANLKVSGMKFHIRAFTAKGLGSVSVMTAVGFFGLMKMDTLIITPTEKDMPLCSYDRVYAMGNDTLIYELYDTLMQKIDLSTLANVKETYAALPEHDLGTHWYDSIKLPESLSKKGKKVHTAGFDACAMEFLNAYLDAAATAPDCNAAEKREKASVYVEGLLTHGGPSTDVFKKGIGEEKTADLFRRILFATKV